MSTQTSGALILMLLGTGVPAGSHALEACSGGGEEELACWFQRGLDLQEQADVAEAPAPLLEEAALAYERALAIDPERGAVLNNLAGVYDDLGRDSEAEDLFERAVFQEEELRPFYRSNFADFLVARGDWDRAAAEYRKALEAVPDYFRAHAGLSAILSEHRPAAIPEYLRFLIDRGQVFWAEEIARARLAEAPSEEFLFLLVEALAGQSPSPDELLPEPAADALRNLIGHPDLGEGAREVLLLRQGEDFDPASYGWWAGRAPKAFRSLIRSFGDAQRRADRPGPARDYFQLAVTLTSEAPDLEALRRMVDLPSSPADLETIDRLAAWNEPAVRKEESRTDRYLYRHDLGLFDVFQKRWNGSRCAPQAIEHLEHAIDLDESPGGDPPFDARIYTRLIEAYLATHQPQKALETWKKLIDVLEKEGLDPVADILTGIAPGGLAPLPDFASLPEVFDDPVLLPDHIRHDPPKGCCPP